jgi:ADP-heptose:LPS heptosyltransferase
VSRPGGRDGVRAVLALRALGLGDALTGVPALRGVRRRWPSARLVLAAPAGVGGWLRDLGLVDAVLPVTGLVPLAPDALVAADRRHPEALAGAGVAVAVNLHGDGVQSARSLRTLDPGEVVAFASAEHPGGPLWDPAEHEVDRWCRLVRSAGGRCGREDLALPEALRAGLPRGAASPRGAAPVPAGTVVVHPGAASASRRWPAPRWAAVVAVLTAGGREVVVTGGPDETALAAEVAAAGARDLSGRLSLAELAAVVGAAGLLLCGDTGVAHLATALRTPSVLLFGPTPPTRWGPAIDPDRHTVLWPAPPGHAGDPHGAAVDPALEAITVEDVLGAAERLAAVGERPRR